MAGDSSSSMVVRVSPDDVVLYANEGMASYLRVSKSDLNGAPLEALAKRAQGEVAACFHRPEGGRRSTSLVTDSDGRVFEVKVISEAGVMDIVFDEVTTADSICRDLRSISGTSVDLLNEEELRTARTPERRFMTVSLSRLNGVTHLAGRLDPMEIQLMVNSFVEEVSDAILDTGCTAYPVSGEAVAGLFGAPRYFADHPLRAIHAACSQIEKTAKLTAGFSRQGKEMPPMSCGIWTGEVFVGSLGNSKTRHYSAIGQPVDFAAELCRLARPGEVLVSETTLKSVVKCLPDGWQAIRADSQDEPDLGDFQWGGQGIEPLSNDMIKGIWLIGPGIDTDSSRVEFYLEYLWSLRISELEDPVPILRVVRPSGDSHGVELSEDNVVSSQFVQTLGKYKLVSVIGTGGMGKVWKALDRYGNIVAIKVLHAGETTSETQVKRFRREAEIMARLPHRNICRVLEMNEFDGIQYLVMEFVDGLTLSELLNDPLPAYLTGGRSVLPDIQQLIAAVLSEKSTRPDEPEEGEEGPPPRIRKSRILPVDQALNVFLRICDAVQFAHEHGVLHRDLKPGNILLREDGEPLVADFGLAKIDSSGDSGPSLSVSGHVVGTLENMAPEQAESSKDVDERADLYSLGTILYQMLTGHRHFDATGNIVTDAQALQHHEPVRLRSLNPKLDADLEIIVLKCLRNTPIQRYRSVAALKADIKHYLRGEAISARPVSAIELVRKLILRNRTVSVVIASSVLILACSSAFAFWKITDRMNAAEQSAKEAEYQRSLAINSANLAKQKSLEAEKSLALAEEQIKKAKYAEKAAADATTLAAKAKDQTADALMDSEEQRKARQAIKERLDLETAKNAALQSELEKKPDKSGTDLQGSTPPPPALDEVAKTQAASGMSIARKAFRQQLTRDSLAQYPHNPEMVARILSEGIEGVSKALLADPTFAPGWMMKGRLHLACMEIKQASESFRKAADVGGIKNAGGPSQLAEECNALIGICDSLRKMSQLSNERYVRGTLLLESRGAGDDLLVAGILAYFKDKAVVKKFSTDPSPIGRAMLPAEQALAILVPDTGSGRIIFNDSGAGKDITISGMQKLVNLAPLRTLSPTRIRIFGAETIDHQSLADLPNLDSLDLGGCLISRFDPPYVRRFRNLRTLSLRDTKTLDLGILSIMPNLETLDISNSLVVDLGQLPFFARSLRTVDAGNLALKNLIGLRDLPLLTKLTISPDKITDKAGLPTLQQLTKLQVLRAPGEPENQAPMVFWQKLAASKPSPTPPEPAKNP